ncbi:MAG: hypothetical protein ACTSYJ_06195 [Candidatus Thorarchaeota archaeon]
MVTKNAQKILNSILRDIPKINDVTTTELLYRCQELSWIMDLDDNTKLWIGLELKGYPNQTLGDSKPSSIPMVHRYRRIKLPAKVVTSRRDSKPTDGSWIFSIVSPCHSLENATNSLTLSESVVDRKARPPMMLTYTGTVSLDSLKGVSAAIRAEIHLFAIQLSLATQIESIVSGFFDNTLVRIANTIGVLAPPTLDLLNDIVEKLKKSRSPEELRVILETLRTILRRVTSVLITKEMLEENEEMPSEGAISTKTSKILDWVLANLEGKSKDEVKQLKKAVTRYHDQLRMLDDLVNKPIHKDLHSIDKPQVERITISIIAWIGDLVEILDKAGYEWVAN